MGLEGSQWGFGGLNEVGMDPDGVEEIPMGLKGS